MKLIRQLWDHTVVDLTQADKEELHAAYEKLFWFCNRNHLDPVAVLLEVEACPPSLAA